MGFHLDFPNATEYETTGKPVRPETCSKYVFILCKLKNNTTVILNTYLLFTSEQQTVLRP